jgi:hypothetical protein
MKWDIGGQLRKYVSLYTPLLPPFPQQLSLHLYYTFQTTATHSASACSTMCVLKSPSKSMLRVHEVIPWCWFASKKGRCKIFFRSGQLYADYSGTIRITRSRNDLTSGYFFFNLKVKAELSLHSLPYMNSYTNIKRVTACPYTEFIFPCMHHRSS